jgi:hypothetical protein
VLQPALFTPDHTPQTTGVPSCPPSYGELMDRATTAVREALTLGATGFTDVLVAHQEVTGYEHFLHVSGWHLRLLAGFAPGTKHLRELTARLTAPATTPPPAPPPGGRWMRASVLLATAHDLLATHVTAPGISATPDAADLLARREAGAGVTRMVGLLLEAANGSWDLLHRAIETQATVGDTKLISNSQAVSLRHTTRAIELYGKATLWDLADTGRESRLDDLVPALPTAATRSQSFESPLAALQALRQISFRQRNGDANISAASLRDLTLLATRVTEHLTGRSPLEAPTTALGRLRAASARDHLDRAHTSWVDAGRGLTSSIRSLTRASSPYGRAIHTLLAQSSPAIDRAVLAALPRLADDTTPTITRLTASGSLVTGERPPGALKVSWRPLTSEEGDELAERFTTAAETTRRAAQATSTPPPRTQATAPSRAHTHEVTRTRQATR